MILEIRHLRAIDAIVREGTVTAAADRLHLTQSAVSHLLKDLEARLGVELFRRDRGMIPTEEGRRLFESAGPVLKEVERAEYDVEQLREGHRGVLRLATECYTCYHWLPSILNRFSRAHPGIDLQIVSDATLDPLASIRAGGLDLAVVHRPPVDDPEIAIAELFTDELVAAVWPGHPLAGRSHLEPEDFVDQTLILHSKPEDSTVMKTFLGPAGAVPERILELQLSEAVIETVKSGIGMTVMARWAIAPQVDAGDLVELRLSEDGLRRKWYAATATRRAEWPPIRSLVALLERGALGAAERCALESRDG